jgi:hypothetical protein
VVFVTAARTAQVLAAAPVMAASATAGLAQTGADLGLLPWALLLLLVGGLLIASRRLTGTVTA